MEAPALWCRVGSHGTRNLTKGSNYKIKKKGGERKGLLAGRMGTEQGPQAPASSPGPFLEKQLRLDVKKRKSQRIGVGERKCSFLVL